MRADVILLAIAPVFFVMALGYGAGRLGVVDNRQVGSLNTLVMSFALPASMFVATASAPRSEMLAQWPLVALLGTVMLAVFLGWYLLAPASRADASMQALTIAFPNFAGVGLPIAAAVAGPAGAVPVAVGLAAGSLLVSPLALLLVEMNMPGRESAAAPGARILAALRRSLTKPVVLAPALGILLSLLRVPIGPVIEASLELIGTAAAGVALFLTGLILSGQAFRLDWRIVGATALADIVRPGVTALLVWMLPVPADIARMAILLAAVPSGFFGILFAVDYRLDSTAAGSMVLASSVLSIATLGVVILVLFPH
ncbi:AEC family transporter [Ancylobacter sp. MQZ15Z-1]|uniref:AEC family transporter n=1 Tax=Ancylobacter mangrovi TaxID=2972472 RepID=A0A9X2PEL6_9HYPH|nr:AEC family transporter [Ancylobacter mangrovi]MCS0497277.1 AEC family transporter [Ancylobacter mangrovi]